MSRYLIEGERGAILHTGDIRCEAAHIERLKLHPQLQSYLWNREETEGRQQLEAIYLDTACVMYEVELPAKV